MEYQKFLRKPFIVEAVQITEENIEELAAQIGSLRHKDNGEPYIFVNPDLIPNIPKVHPGFWLVKMGDNKRCYSRRIFSEQFIEATPTNEELTNIINNEVAGVGATEELPQSDAYVGQNPGYPASLETPNEL